MSASQRCCQRVSISRGTYFDVVTESTSSRIQSLISPGIARILHAASDAENKKTLSSVQGRKGFRGTTLVGGRHCCAHPLITALTGRPAAGYALFTRSARRRVQPLRSPGRIARFAAIGPALWRMAYYSSSSRVFVFLAVTNPPSIRWTQRDSNPRPSRLQFELTAGTFLRTIAA